MRTVTIVLELEDEKFNEMEKILLNDSYEKCKESWTDEQWTRFVIETYEDTELYLDCNDGDLEKAYKDRIYDC